MNVKQELRVDPEKVATIDQYLRLAFGGREVQSSYDPSNASQFYWIGHGATITHRIFVAKEFLDDHTLEDIVPLLRKRRTITFIRAAGTRGVVITNVGIEVPRPDISA
ncbi:MAG TPA: hypothetical protein VMS64_20325 [Candidatus Methylomirabilis sp.]|nr:hypothetical protein [Candidatus Methylomirabilis sp.]